MAIRTLTLATGLTLALAVPPAAAQEPAPEDSPSGDSPGEMALEGVEQLMNAIETFVHSLPMYGAPRIDEDGNIVIPRLDNGDQPDRTPERKPDKPDQSPNGDGGVTEI
ncbi:hypothetical protein CKO28_21065 [Rhodovibrio sodomensis]|uniref:AAA+ family ATPase n=1 Tax=Rhodovibrio sodomensis TaxID=1088 RepID=A0ABS1DM06_9PROT|nr:hypothetical protein [Rhodovibrio sodomensis]MBK1670518.1 hypothetical protein [Rhodovibrio sodomensis]